MYHLLNEEKLEKIIPDFKTRGMDLDLQRITEGLKILGNPCSSTPAIHIAGTNGKGSISSFLKSSLNAAGINHGVTTSPHLISWLERIVVNKKTISYKDFFAILEEINPKLSHLKLTTFEIIITVALKYFASSNVELIVLETGLGGRLDATTAHPYRPIIAMGSIGLDHCEYLGNTIEKIAKEKAEVITPGSIVLTGNQQPIVMKVLEEISTQRKARLEYIKPLDLDWQIGIPGQIQKENAAVAKAALEALSTIGIHIKMEYIRDGISNANWPGRLQIAYWGEMPIVLDGAHNPQAAKQLSKERIHWENNTNGINWILAIQRTKDAPSMLKELIKPNDKAWIIKVPNHKSWTYQELINKCPEFSEQVFEANQLEQVLLFIKSRKELIRSKTVIAGSLYLIGDILKRNIIRNKSF